MTSWNSTAGRVAIFHKVLTAMSREHSKGHLGLQPSVLAIRIEDLSEDSVRKVLTEAFANGWVTLDQRLDQYRLRDGVVAPIMGVKNCDVCWYVEGHVAKKALTDARTIEGRWGNLCALNTV